MLDEASIRAAKEWVSSHGAYGGEGGASECSEAQKGPCWSSVD